MTLIRALILVALIASSAIAAVIPGTSITMEPPPGFTQTDRFPGFINQETSASILIQEIPGPYNEVIKGFSDPTQLASKGMELINHFNVEVDGLKSILLKLEQSAYGTVFQKLVLAVNRYGSTTIIMATYPADLRDQMEQPLKTSLLAAKFGAKKEAQALQQSNIAALSFEVTPVSPFEIAKVMGNNLILSPGGQFPVKDENVPFMVLGLSMSKDMAISDRQAFAEQGIRKTTAAAANIRILGSQPVNIDGLEGFTTLAEGDGTRAGTALTIYQVVLYDADGYCFIQGFTPSLHEDKYLSVFEDIANSFKMKR